MNYRILINKVVFPVVNILLITGSTLYISCFQDDFDNILKYEAIHSEMFIPQKHYPVPGGNGLITTGAVTATSIQLFWTEATDVETPQADLEYRLFYSDSYNIGSPSDAQANGTPATAWTREMATAVAAGLSPGTSYFFNVIARDADGNMSAYMIVSSTTQSDAMYMFSAGTYQGNLTSVTSSMSPRNRIDMYCSDAKNDSYPYLPCINVRTFISITSSDDIARMPANFGVPTNKRIIGPTGTQIADNWFDLLDGSIDTDLQSAGISSSYWWSGSNSGGTFMSSAVCASCNTCSGWTDGTNASLGIAARHNRTDSTWINDGTRNCNNQLNVLCLCW
jgi:chitodextrinase